MIFAGRGVYFCPVNCLLFDTPPPFRLSPESPKKAHIESVLKTEDGGEIFAGQKNGSLFVCKFSRLSGGGVLLSPLREIPAPRGIGVCFAAAFTRPQIAKRLLFEAACFGVERIIFYAAAKGEAGYLKSDLYTGGECAELLEKGAEQACATAIPEFKTAASLAEALEMMPSRALKIAPDLYEATASIERALAESSSEKTNLVLGGERGFSGADRNLLRESSYALVSLGARVLRTDSAAITALYAVSSSLNRKSTKQ